MSATGLSPSLVGLPRPFPYRLLFLLLHETPHDPRPASGSGLGSSPFARRYLGNHGCFLFLRVLRCFSSPGLPHRTYEFSTMSHPITDRGFPHSDTLGSQPAYGSPRHFGVRPVLRRHLAPRHPPRALTRVTTGGRPGAAHCFVTSFARSVSYLTYAPSLAQAVPRTACAISPASLCFACGGVGSLCRWHNLAGRDQQARCAVGTTSLVVTSYVAPLAQQKPLHRRTRGIYAVCVLRCVCMAISGCQGTEFTNARNWTPAPS